MNFNEPSLELPPGEHSPEQIAATLGLLMRWYLRRRSTAIARAVVKHIDALLVHPDFNAHPDERCVYRRLAMQWRYVVSVASPWMVQRIKITNTLDDQRAACRDRSMK